MKELLTMMVAAFFGCPLFATTWYVNGTSGSDGYSGKSSDLAKKTIQAAIDASSSGDTILVAAGIYAPIKTYDKRITIKSIYGPRITTIDGGETQRCAELIESCDWDWIMPVDELLCGKSTLDGFTLTNGYAENDVGVKGGVVKNCIITGNHGWDDSAGGGFARFYNCLIFGNVTDNYGGRGSGSGIRISCAYNCTIVNNTSHGGGGAVAGKSMLYNCIVAENYDNEGRLDNVYSDEDESTLLNCCVASPGFVNSGNGDYRLAANSPCIDAGDNAYVTTETDLDGNARIVNGKVDVGCYEYQSGAVVTKCAVTFDAAGGTAGWTKGEVAKGVAVGTLPTAMRAGYEFLGWFTAAVGGTQVTAATVVTADVTFYAQWKPIRYAITYVNTMGRRTRIRRATRSRTP